MNLLVALDVLLEEGSVTGAARRLGLSTSAMSRTLARLRSATGDPLLVRAGRGLVPTPHAAALRARVHALTGEVRAVLRPPDGGVDLAALSSTFTIRAGEWFMELISAPLVAALTEAAPHIRLRFAPKPDKDARLLRDGRIDLEVGLRGEWAPELCEELLFRDEFVGVVRTGHPLLAGGKVTPERFAACRHVMASPVGEFSGPVDDALDKLGIARAVSVVVPGFPDAMRLVRTSDFVATVPGCCLGNALTRRHATASGLKRFALPVSLPKHSVSAMWHPRMEADPAHRWLRNTVIALCRQAWPAA
ncbi:LysR family transcriptional regulator [Paraburkholderia sp. B3]|uniref:LysR family transcriptional regulator n=1 Tax=Paraburkholderia sp. B3 TaxID=3134791 RepID=UPI003982CD75